MNIEQLITYFCDKWELSNLRSLDLPFLNNYIAVAFSAKYNKDVVLKILLAETHEIEALQAFKGRGCVALLEYDFDKKGMILEYIQPGTTLKSLFPKNDSKAVHITAQIIRELVIRDFPKDHVFKTVNQWLETLHSFKGKKIPEYLLKKAQQLSKELLDTNLETYLLHGDLHHENILQSAHGWITIDPKGVIGPLEYEVGRFIMNPIPELLQQSDAKEIIKKRIDIFSDIFGFQKQRLLDWVFVQAILSACWTEQNENETFFNYFVKFAQTIE